jgi:CubicO group peptidase (beta-lactamase class C family)
MVASLPVAVLPSAAVLVVVLASTACGGTDADPLALRARVDSIVSERVSAEGFQGGLLVARGSDVVHRGATGTADRARAVPNTPETPNPIHSITKSFTAIVVLQLVEEGVLALDGTLDEYVPSYRGSAADRTTLHHLLSHTSGIPDYLFAIPGYLGPEPPHLSRDSVTALVGAMPLEFEPGEGFGYSNTGYVLLGKIVEDVTGRSYAEVVRERIFDPLGMADSRWTPDDSGEGVSVQYDGDTVAPDALILPGEGGIVSTLDDMHRFALAIGSPELLSPESWELAFTPHARPEDALRFHPAHTSPYGYGFSIEEREAGPGRTIRFALHGGQGYGGGSMLERQIGGEAIGFRWSNVSGPPLDLSEALRVVAEAPPRP